MNIKQTISRFLGVALILSGGLAVALAPVSVYANEDGNNNCGVDTAIISCSGVNNNDGADIQETALWYVITLGIKILVCLVGVAALAGVVYGAVLYTTAGNSVEQVKKAKGVFTNIALGVVAFALMYALLNFLIPGGINWNF